VIFFSTTKIFIWDYQKQFHPLIAFLLKYQKRTKQSIKEKEIAKVPSWLWGHLQG
jgi:hypothetical protein